MSPISTRRIHRTLEPVEPVGLVVMFGGEHASVEKDQQDDEPVERLRFDDSSTELATATVGPVKPTTTAANKHVYMSAVK